MQKELDLTDKILPKIIKNMSDAGGAKLEREQMFFEHAQAV